MIVNDCYRFYFMHVPKCAGTALRNYLEPLNDCAGDFYFNGAHAELGYINYSHLPLFALKAHFPTWLVRIRGYAGFALVREPFERFASALGQHLAEFGETPLSQLDRRALNREIARVTDYLAAANPPGTLLPASYIHFQRQVDYVYLDNVAWVQNVYPIAELNALLAALNRRTDGAVPEPEQAAPGRTNVKVTYRGPLRYVAPEALRPVLAPLVRRVLPETALDRLRGAIYRPASSQLQKALKSAWVQDFVRAHYSDDIALFQRIAHPATA